jgi:hypothetical protein
MFEPFADVKQTKSAANFRARAPGATELGGREPRAIVFHRQFQERVAPPN